MLSAEYYREEKAASRITLDWDKEQFLKKLPEDLKADVSNIMNEIETREDRLQYSFGKGAKTGSLLLGAKVLGGKRVNNLLAIWTNGEATLYFSLAQTGLSESQKNALVSEIGKWPFLKESYEKILAGMRTRKYGAEPKFKLKDVGAPGEIAKKLLELLEEFYRIANG